jgi:signal transduction histidine kinase
MTRLPLRERFLLWSGTASAITLASVVILVDVSFRANIREHLELSLSFASQVAEQMRTRQIESRIAETAQVAMDTRLRAAVETGDPATVSETLAEVIPNNWPGWSAVMTLDGSVLVATRGAPTARLRDAGMLLEEALYYDTGDLWRDGDVLNDVAASSILFGDSPLGVLVTGQPVDAASVTALENGAGRPVALLIGKHIVFGRQAQALSEQAKADLIRRANAIGDSLRTAELDAERFFTAVSPLASSRGEKLGSAILLGSYDEALEPSKTLRAALIVIFLLGLLLTSFMSGVFSRGITVPVDRLLDDTEWLAHGNLDRPITPVRDDEIGRLAKAFDEMRVSLKEAHSDLIRAERLGAIGQAASAVAHDLAQPLTTIASAIGLLRMDDGDINQREVYLEAIENELDRLQRMKQEIVEFARGEALLDPTDVRIDGFLENTVSGLRADLERRDIRLTVHHGYAGEWAIDSYRLGRVMENLIRNAAAAISRSGTIDVRSRAFGDSLTIEVEDNGPGIPEAILDHLFEPFVSHGKKEGTGLGLAIARNVVTQHGGTIDVRSSREGTCFVIVLPRREGPKEKKADVSHAELLSA